MYDCSEQRQKYTIRGLNTVKIMSSVVHLELDSEDFITKMEDRWDGKALPTGSIANALRGLNGRTMPSLIGVPKVDAEKK
jgi:hypothetical protein